MEEIMEGTVRKEMDILYAVKKAAYDLNTNPSILENILAELVNQRDKIDELENIISELKKEEKVLR